jgi:uncharacterized SAM-binding protein YcdF (DUF218 family)
MFFIVSKLAAFITDPVIWILLCFVLAFFLKRKLCKRIFLFTAIGLFLILGNGAFISRAEVRWSKDVVFPIDTTRVYDYALIQGGFGDYNWVTKKTQVFEEAERLIEPVRLYRMGKVKKIFVTGDGSFGNKKYPEAKVAFINYLVSLGVFESDIVLEPKARNTHQSAAETRSILGEELNKRDNGIGGEEVSLRNSLLVTSAIHMKRTVKCYRKLGMNPVPYATSVPIPYKLDITNFNLGSVNLYRWQKLFHEWVGMVTYKVVGYI